jgi:hypothetical protein
MLAGYAGQGPVGNPDTRFPPFARGEEKTAGALACLAAIGGLRVSQFAREGHLLPFPRLWSQGGMRPGYGGHRALRIT